MRLRPSRKVSAKARDHFRKAVAGLPALTGEPIRVEFRPELTAYRGKLLSGYLQAGTAVHAATFIRQRRVVLESELLRKPGTLQHILVHEVFHFVWTRLSNACRREYASILSYEAGKGARGELGESAGVKKLTISSGEHLLFEGVRWRDYVCESFCDTAAWLYCGVRRRRREFTLAKRWRDRRRRWFHVTFSQNRRY